MNELTDGVDTTYTILVVEDNEALCRLIQKNLQRLGYHTEGVFSGSEAIERAVEIPDALLLLDYQLLDMTGKDVINILSQRQCRVPFIIVTGHGDERMAVEMMKLGASDYLVKDNNFLELLPSTLNHVIGQLTAERNLAEANELLLLSAQQWQTTYNAISDSIWLLDTEGRILQCNNATVDLLGIPRDNILGHFCREVMHCPSKPIDDCPMDRIQDTHRRESVIVSMNDRWLEITVDPILDAAGNLVGAVHVVSDVTKSKQMEVALAEERAMLAQRVEERTSELSIANAELARANRLKDEFLANMSHELRTPLNVILGFSESLQEGVYGPLSEQQNRSLGVIKGSGSHLLDMINDVLDLARIGSGKLELEMDSVSVESICRASLQFVRQQAQQKRLRISSSFDNTATTLKADARRLKQILVNLLSNAVKFTPDGGQVGIDVVSDAKQEAVHFIVRDTGIGIPQEQIPLLFRPFVQLDGGLSRSHEGTGLGLALVHRLVEMHGGSVSLESEAGKGSRFTVSLPWNISAETAQTADEAEGSEADIISVEELESSQIILLVEDNEDNIDTISAYLQAKGYHVIVARNGSEAIERIGEEKPDLILMDIQMPVMDGLEATRVIRANADADIADIPIIALTALAMPGDRERCLEAGADDYVCKPVSFKGLVEMIKTRLNRKQVGEGDLV